MSCADGGTVALVVPSALDAQPAFRPFLETAARIAGPEARSLLGAYFVCGDLDELAADVASAGLTMSVSRPVTGTYAAPSVDAAVRTEVESTPLVERLSVEAYQQLRDESVEVMAPWTQHDGSLVAPFTCNVVAATK